MTRFATLSSTLIDSSDRSYSQSAVRRPKICFGDPKHVVSEIFSDDLDNWLAKRKARRTLRGGYTRVGSKSGSGSVRSDQEMTRFGHETEDPEAWLGSGRREERRDDRTRGRGREGAAAVAWPPRGVMKGGKRGRGEENERAEEKKEGAGRRGGVVEKEAAPRRRGKGMSARGRLGFSEERKERKTQRVARVRPTRAVGCWAMRRGGGVHGAGGQWSPLR